MNKVILIGRIGKDPETKDFEGSFVSNFSVATGEKFKNKESGEWEERTEWHNVQIWNSTFTKEYLKKGDLVSIEGKIQTRSYMKDEEKRYITEINAHLIQGLAKKDPNTPAEASAEQPDALPF